MEIPARVRFNADVVAKLQQIPGVDIATSAAFMPMTDMRATRRFAIEGEPLPKPGEEPLAIDLPAGPGYAKVLGLKIIQGRWIEDQDTPASKPVVVISESFAKQHFPNGALGRRLRYFASRPNQPEPPRPEIVGVVSDVREFAMAEAAVDQMYVPHAQRPWGFTSFFVRTSGDPRSVMSALQAAVRAVDPERPVEQLRTLDELVSESTADRRGLSALLIVAAIVAMLISTIGVYGVTAATTAARKRELAIRAAIGADRRGLMSLVIRQGMLAAAIGITAGIGGGIAASGLLQSVLFEVQARDPLTFAGVATALLLTCGLASYIPARRALQANPAEALRAE
jgi:putative ABC transport system permease protein